MIGDRSPGWREKPCAWYQGSSADNLNHYQIFSAGGYEFLHITLQTNPGQAARDWANARILENPGKPTIISTHDYLDLSGRSAAGDNIWTDLVNDNPQVFMVLNGHSRGVNRTVSTNSGNKKVLEMLANYQDYTTPSGNGNTFSAGKPIQPADIAGATSASPTLLLVSGPPDATWDSQAANAPECSS